MTQPINSGAPAPVQGVTGGPGLNPGVAGVEGSTGNVVITPPSNTFQLRKGDSPQSLQVYEFYHSNLDNVRIELLTATGGPEFIGVRAAPAGVVRNLRVGTTGNLILNAGNADWWTIDATTGQLFMTGAAATSGTIRLLNGAQITFRNGAGTNNIAFTFDNADRINIANASPIRTAAGASVGDIPFVYNGVLYWINVKQP